MLSLKKMKNALLFTIGGLSHACAATSPRYKFNAMKKFAFPHKKYYCHQTCFWQERLMDLNFEAPVEHLSIWHCVRYKRLKSNKLGRNVFFCGISCVWQPAEIWELFPKKLETFPIFHAKINSVAKSGQQFIIEGGQLCFPYPRFLCISKWPTARL